MATSTSARRRHGVGLCLSGGGYRAALFHLGALRRLDELGVLGQVRTISAVSGGAIIANLLADPRLVWPEPPAPDDDRHERPGPDPAAAGRASSRARGAPAGRPGAGVRGAGGRAAGAARAAQHPHPGAADEAAALAVDDARRVDPGPCRPARRRGAVVVNAVARQRRRRPDRHHRCDRDRLRRRLDLRRPQRRAPARTGRRLPAGLRRAAAGAAGRRRHRRVVRLPAVLRADGVRRQRAPAHRRIARPRGPAGPRRDPRPDPADRRRGLRQPRARAGLEEPLHGPGQRRRLGVPRPHRAHRLRPAAADHGDLQRRRHVGAPAVAARQLRPRRPVRRDVVAGHQGAAVLSGRDGRAGQRHPHRPRRVLAGRAARARAARLPRRRRGDPPPPARSWSASRLRCGRRTPTWPTPPSSSEPCATRRRGPCSATGEPTYRSDLAAAGACPADDRRDRVSTRPTWPRSPSCCARGDVAGPHRRRALHRVGHPRLPRPRRQAAGDADDLRRVRRLGGQPPPLLGPQLRRLAAVRRGRAERRPPRGGRAAAARACCARSSPRTSTACTRPAGRATCSSCTATSTGWSASTAASRPRREDLDARLREANPGFDGGGRGDPAGRRRGAARGGRAGLPPAPVPGVCQRPGQARRRVLRRVRAQAAGRALLRRGRAVARAAGARARRCR